MNFVRTRVANACERAGILAGLLAALAMAAFLISVAPAAAQSDDRGKDVTLEGSHTDVQFLAGRSVHIKAEVSDDVFAAGRNVTFDAASVKNAFAVGYDIELQGGSVADMFALGANVNIGGAVADDLLSAGRSIRLSASGSVGGDARLAGETIEVEGRIGGNLRAAARRITIDGEVAGKVDLAAERIVIGPRAVINGDLVYRSASAPEIAEGATITGTTRRIEVRAPDFTAIIGIGIALATGWALAMLVLVALLQWVFPGLMSEAAGRMRGQPWANLGLGIAISLIASAVSGLLAVSVIGLPLGAALALMIAIAWILGLGAVSLCIGLMLRGLFGRAGAAGSGARAGWAVIGAVIIGIVCLVPFVGSIISGLAVATGFGAVAIETWRRLRAA